MFCIMAMPTQYAGKTCWFHDDDDDDGDAKKNHKYKSINILYSRKQLNWFSTDIHSDEPLKN